MSWRAAHVMGLGALVSGLLPATIAKADDQQLVEDYLATRGASGAVVRPITDDYVGRTFPTFNFFGVIFRQYPKAGLARYRWHSRVKSVRPFHATMSLTTWPSTSVSRN